MQIATPMAEAIPRTGLQLINTHTRRQTPEIQKIVDITFIGEEGESAKSPFRGRCKILFTIGGDGHVGPLKCTLNSTSKLVLFKYDIFYILFIYIEIRVALKLINYKKLMKQRLKWNCKRN